MSFEGVEITFYANFSEILDLDGPYYTNVWVQISCFDIKNNLDDLHVNKAWFWHQEVAEDTSKCIQIEHWRAQNLILCFLFRNIGPHMNLWVQISYVDLENNLDGLHINKTWFFNQEVANT